jgi:hypothetical protein
MMTVARRALDGVEGVAEGRIRRRIRAGELEAETVLRPQGSAFVVRLPVQASPGVSDAYDSRQEPRDTMRTEAAPEQAMLALVQAAVTPILVPVMARMAEQEATIRQQAETIGELRAENRALVARTAAQDEEALRDLGELFPSRWRVLWPWVLGVLAIVAAAALLVWPR